MEKKKFKVYFCTILALLIVLTFSQPLTTTVYANSYGNQTMKSLFGTTKDDMIDSPSSKYPVYLDYTTRNSIKISWDKYKPMQISDDSRYIIGVYDPKTKEILKLYSTNNTYIEIKDLEPDTEYDFIVGYKYFFREPGWVNIPGAPPETCYVVGVYQITGYKTGPDESVPPKKPMIYLNIGDDYVEVHWASSNDNYSAKENLTYEPVLIGEGKTTVIPRKRSKVPSPGSYVFKDLKEDVVYQAYVNVYDEAGNVTKSDVLNARVGPRYIVTIVDGYIIGDNYKTQKEKHPKNETIKIKADDPTSKNFVFGGWEIEGINNSQDYFDNYKLQETTMRTLNRDITIIAKYIYAGPPVTIIKQPQSQGVKKGEKYTFSIEAKNAEKYQWEMKEPNSSKWTNINQNTAELLSRGGAIKSLDGAQFRCIVSNGGGSVTSNIATLTIDKNFDVNIEEIAPPIKGEKLTASLPDAGKKIYKFYDIKWGVMEKNKFKEVDISKAYDGKGITLMLKLGDGRDLPEGKEYYKIGSLSAEKIEDDTITVKPEIGDKERGITVTEYDVAVKNLYFTFRGEDGKPKIDEKEDDKKTVEEGLEEGEKEGIEDAVPMGDSIISEPTIGGRSEKIEEGSKANENKKGPVAFIDVPVTAWYYQDVKRAYETGLIDGKTLMEYKPNDNMSFSEAIKLAACMHQLYHNGKITLGNGKDVWYSTYIDYAAKNRIIDNKEVKGKERETIKRKEFVDIFYNALPKEEYVEINKVKDNAIPDVKIKDNYADKIYIFYKSGILTGSDAKGTFKPESNIQRSEVAAILTRMFEGKARKNIEL